MSHRVLIVDDEKEMLETCKETLKGTGIQIVLESTAQGAVKRFDKERFDLMVTDIKMPGINGLDLLKLAKTKDPQLSVILITAYPDLETAVEALHNNAEDYLIKPFHPDEFRLRINRELESRRLRGENRLLVRHMEKRYRGVEIIGKSPALRKVLELVDKVASTPADIIILGESGTGKELIARRAHLGSERKGRFVPVDCGAIPETLLENEFFGHERGAYTGAGGDTPGLLEFAHGGSFFLDEICELPLALQAKLLRTLQERQLRRVGGRNLVDVDIRVIAATNKNIEREVAEGRFREELYFRLNVITVHLPPLRERREDIALLVEHFLPKFAAEFHKDIRSLSDETLDILKNYSWPGNIRELQNMLKKAIVNCGGTRLEAEHLAEILVEQPEDPRLSETSFKALRKKSQASFERDYFSSMLKQARGDAKTAAEMCGMPLSNFYWYLKKHDIKPSSFRD